MIMISNVHKKTLSFLPTIGITPGGMKWYVMKEHKGTIIPEIFSIQLRLDLTFTVE